MQSDIVLSSRVRLARNYADLPFDLASEPEQAETCILRTLSALFAVAEGRVAFERLGRDKRQVSVYPVGE